jgi:hypothetical protein
MVDQSHRERVEVSTFIFSSRWCSAWHTYVQFWKKFNDKLTKLTEHNDIPRVCILIQCTRNYDFSFVYIYFSWVYDELLYFLTLYIQDFGCRERLILSTDGFSFTISFSRQHQRVCLEIPCVFLCSALFQLMCKLKNRSGDFSGNPSYYQNLHRRHDEVFPSTVTLENILGTFNNNNYWTLILPITIMMHRFKMENT